MKLVPFWFVVIAVLWTGFCVLEGFDFGVGMLHGVVGRDEAGRRAAINTIGPLWDGNEVWLIVAAAALFAAFPGWYATMFSGFYLVLVLLLVALIVRPASGVRSRGTWLRSVGGLLGWWIWLFIHIAFLTGYRNRLGALLTWWLAFSRDIRRERTFTTQEIETLRDIYAGPPAPGGAGTPAPDPQA